MNQGLDISIVVLNWNTSDLLPGALHSIPTAAQGLSWEVVVIDNASSDGGFACVPDDVKNDPHFTFIQNSQNLGWAAINPMLERRGKYIATVDPDAVLHAGALQKLFAFMESHPRAGAATATLLNPDGSPQIYFRRLMTPSVFFFTTLFGRVIDKYLLGLRRWKFYRYEDLDITQESEVEQPSWPCLVWRREALGGYIVEPLIPFYFLDVDMSRRVYTLGYHIYVVPEAMAVHLKSTSYGKRESVWRRREYNRSIMVYFRKHYPLWAPLVWLQLSIDRALRALMLALTGREPLR